jgi:hypothetical protein
LLLSLCSSFSTTRANTAAHLARLAREHGVSAVFIGYPRGKSRMRAPREKAGQPVAR